MKIAVPYENGEICSHLAQVKEFLIFDVVDDEIISTKTVKQTYANEKILPSSSATPFRSR